MALLTLPWWPLSPWLSPAAAWFIFFNAVVGAIAVMSSSSSAQAATPSRRRLCRSGSSSSVLLDRIRSFSIFSVHHSAGGVITAALPFDDGSGSDGSDPHCYYCCSRSRQAEGAPDTQTQLPRSPMPVAADAASGGGTATSAPVSMAKAKGHGAPAPAPAPADQEDKAEAVLQDDSIGLDEAYALAQRHRAAQPLAPPPPPPASTTPTPSPARRTKKKPAAKVAEAGIRRRAQGCGGAEALEALLEGKAELNARADLFIRQFREDLKLQRLNSILRHTQALGSPTAAAR